MSDPSTLLHWISANPNAVLNIVLGSGAISLVLEKVLTKYQVESKKVAFILLHVFGIVTAVLATLVANLKGFAPAGVFAAVTIIAGIWHRFLISGIYTKEVEPELNKLANSNTSSITSPTLATPLAPADVTPPLVGQ